MIHGINHLTLAVRDLATSVRFYETTLGGQLRVSWPNGAYILLGDLWLALIADGNRRTDGPRDYTHVGLTVTSAGLLDLQGRLRAWGAPIWKENTSEGESLYFEDPDGHRLELHVGDLASRLRSLNQASRSDVRILEDP